MIIMDGSITVYFINKIVDTFQQFIINSRTYGIVQKCKNIIYHSLCYKLIWGWDRDKSIWKHSVLFKILSLIAKYISRAAAVLTSSREQSITGRIFLFLKINTLEFTNLFFNNKLLSIASGSLVCRTIVWLLDDEA